MASLYKKPVIVRDPKTGEKVKSKSRKWWGRFTDALGREKRIPLCTDKQAALAMLKEEVQKVDRQRAGLEDPVDDQMQRPIKEHVADFRRHQESKDNTPEYIDELIIKIERFVKECRWRRVVHITASDVESFLGDLRSREELSIQTSNHYLRAIKGFTRWLTINRRLTRNPLDSLSMLNARVDRRHDRRPLSSEEFSRLLRAAETGPPIESLSGIDRAMLYVLAAWTGLRRGELGSLTLGSFKLKGNPPTVTVEAAYSKHRREDKQVLHQELVQRLKAWLKIREPADGEILFAISKRVTGVNRKTAKMMRDDLAAARRVWLSEAKDKKELRRREKSDFLKYQDSAGRFADFHANRHTFITNLCKAEVSPKMAQALARHSDIRLTMNLYSHVDLGDQSAAIRKLPGVGGDGSDQSA